MLVGMTILLCSVLYPLLVLGFGQALFPHRANGSLIGPDGKPAGPDDAVGSSQVAQKFEGDEWFSPRPSATTPAYNAAASSGSNYGANNPKLRDRVARQLGPIVKYATGPKAGKRVGPDVEDWFLKKPDRAATWAKNYPTLASAWVTSDDACKAYVLDWVKGRPEVLAAWQEENEGKEHDPSKPEELAAQFFASHAKAHPTAWPATVKVKAVFIDLVFIQSVKAGEEIQAVFFESWLQDKEEGNDRQAELEKVPADMVTASGSGLDPHISLRNARQQLDRVVDAQAKKTGADPAGVRSAIEDVLKEHAFTPLGGLAGGEPIVNVLEVNLAVRQKMNGLAAR
jgi:K+-transporting ATPase ATPase C chain